jgi:hypothetical protein
MMVVSALAIVVCACGAWGTTLRVVSYNIDCSDQGSDNNITGTTHSLPTVIQGIGLHHIGSNTQPVDVLGVEELNSTTLSAFIAQLNNIYGAGTYAFDPTADPNTGGGPDGLIYNTHTVQVVSARALPTGQTVLLQSNGSYTMAHSPGGGVNGVTRGPMLYQLRPIGYGSSADFYMYVSHARNGSDNAIGDARYAEAQEVRSDAKYNLPAGAHVIYSGDWNLFNGSAENAYKCLTGQTTSDNINWSDGSTIWANANPTQAYDPTSRTNPPTTTTWTNVAGDNASYLYGDATDSLTSRIDIQLVNAPMLGVYNNQGGVQLAPDTSDPFDTSNFPSAQYPYGFESFGNNGTTPRSSAVTSSSNHSLDDLTSTVPSAATVYADLKLTGSGSTFKGSDHYPVVGDYNVVAPTPPTPTQVVSRKLHGGVPFDINMPLTGSSGIECRTGGASGNHTLVITFTDTVVSGSAAVTSGTGSVAGTPAFSGNTMTINLTGVANAQTVTVTLSNVTDNFSQTLADTAISAGFLLGDTNGNRVVNASDVSQTKGQAGQQVTGSNFRTDVNANGTINATDASLVKANLGTALP